MQIIAQVWTFERFNTFSAAICYRVKASFETIGNWSFTRV